MRRWMLAGALALAAVACGGAPKPAAPIESRGEEPAAPAMTDPVEVLRALGDAARRDDGAALDALVHPVHGMWLWDQPGAAVSPAVHVTAGSREAPTARLASSGMNDYWKEAYWRHVAAVSDGLARLDRDPAERFAAIYGSCDLDDSSGGTDLRAWLVTKDSFEHHAQLLVDTELEKTMAPELKRDMTHFRSWGLDVWLFEDDGRLWVAHVMVWTPCDA